MLNEPRVLICAVANNDYFHYLEGLVLSIIENSKNCSMLISLVNVPTYKIEWLKSIKLDLTIDAEYIDFPSKELEKGYCTNKRVDLLCSKYSAGYDWILYVDANVLINRNLNDFFKEVEGYDSVIMLDTNHITSTMNDKQLQKYPKGPLGTPYYGVCLAAIQGYKIGSMTHKFLGEYRQLVSSKLYSWYADQEALYLMYTDYYSNIKFYFMNTAEASSNNPLSLFIYMKGGGDNSVYQERASFFLNGYLPNINKKLNRRVLSEYYNGNENKISLIRFLKRKILKQPGKYHMFEKMEPKNLLRRVDWYINKYVLKNKIIKRKLKEVTMLLDTQTDGISRTLCLKRVREEDMVFLMKKYIKKGQVIIDCGSNIGFYPLLESKLVGDNGHLVCIEPDFRNYKLLQKNIALISDVKTDLFNIAISDKKGTMSLDIGGPSNLNKIVRSDREIALNSVDVEVDTIDNLMGKLHLKPDFIRMDIEGHEVEVLSGMRDTIKNAASGFVIFFELHPNEYDETHSLEGQLEFLYEEGFECEVIVSAGEPIPALYKKLGYSPDMVIKTDNLERGIYYNVNRKDSIKLATSLPKCSRYILLQKK